MRRDLEEWAEDHGYGRYHCPGCHRMYWSDSGPVGNCPCGWMPEEAKEEERDESE